MQPKMITSILLFLTLLSHLSACKYGHRVLELNGARGAEVVVLVCMGVFGSSHTAR